MAHERGSVGPCMYVQSYYLFFLVVYMFIKQISRDDRDFRMQLNFSRELQPLHRDSYSWFLSQASLNYRELAFLRNWVWYFNKNIQQKQYYYASGILHVSQFFCQPFFTSSAELVFFYSKLEKLASSTLSLHAIIIYRHLISFMLMYTLVRTIYMLRTNMACTIWRFNCISWNKKVDRVQIWSHDLVHTSQLP